MNGKNENDPKKSSNNSATTAIDEASLPPQTDESEEVKDPKDDITDEELDAVFKEGYQYLLDLLGHDGLTHLAQVKDDEPSIHPDILLGFLCPDEEDVSPEAQARDTEMKERFLKFTEEN